MTEDSSAPHDGAGAIDYEAFREREDFKAMKRRLFRFVFPVTAAFLAWFLLYVILGAFAHDFMAQPLLGLNVGMWFGLLQFVSTFGITTWYVMFANRKIDPLTEELRGELETLAASPEGATR